MPSLEQEEFVQQILAGNIRSIARAATLIENHAAKSTDLLARLAPHAGHASIIGVTGAPGVGKSTLCDQMIAALRAEKKTVALIAVDPSSPVSGGAVLGDRVRMQRHHNDPGVFIRSMATRGTTGGLAQATAALTTLFDAAGRNVILIETVGVGQAEVEIARLAQVTILVLAPGSGDDVQAMKAGLMEVATLFAINKADLPGAEKLRQELHAAVDDRPVVLTVASEGRGVTELLKTAEQLKTTQPLHASSADRRASSLGAPARALPAPESDDAAVIDHLGIAVRSVDAALGFYEQQLGLHVALRETVAQEKVNVAMLPVGDSRIELLEAAEPDSVIAKFIEKRGEGLHHVALRVPDLAATVARLKASGGRILNEPRMGAGGHLYVFVHPSSTGGVLLELIQG